MEQLRQHAAASKPASPAQTPPRRHSNAAASSDDDDSPVVPVVTHATQSFETVAKASAAPSSSTAPVAAASVTRSVLSSLPKGVDPDSDDDVDMASLTAPSASAAAPTVAEQDLQDILNQSESDSEDDTDETRTAALASAAALNSKAGAAADDESDEEDTEDLSPKDAESAAAKPAAATSAPGDASTSSSGGAAASPAPVGGQLMSEADLLQIRNPLTRAEALEQNLSTLGNYTVVNPLASQIGKARSSQPVPGKGAATGLLVPGSASASANLVRLTALPNVQAELNRARPSIGHAVACCLETHSKFLCVATSKGVVLFFDRGFEKLLMGLGKVDDATSKARGSITCLDLNVAGDMLLVGYSKGTVCIWDITHKTLVKTIPDACSPQQPITMLKFTRQDAAAKSWTFLAADTLGCLNLFVLSSKLFSYGVDKQMLLQGKAGPVLASSVLTATPSVPHPADRMALVAIATELFTAVVSLEPQVAIVYRVPREKDERVGVQPCLAWRPLHPRDECLTNPAFLASADGDLITPEESELVRHPTLLMCRGRSMMLLQAVPMTRAEQSASGSKFPWSFRTLASQSMPREIKSCSWLAQGQLIVLILAPTDDILILDPFSPNLLCLATLPGGTIGIVHQEFYFDPDTGRPEQTFTPSIHATDDCLLLLGTDNVSEVKVLPWDKRLDAFIRGDEDNPQWHHCLALALDLHNGTAIAPFPLPRERAAVRRIMQYKMVELMGCFIAEMLQGQQTAPSASAARGAAGGEVDLLTGGRPRGGSGGSGAKDALRTDAKYVKVLAATCIAYCIAIDRLDILFSDIYDKFRTHFPHAFAQASSAAAGSSAAAVLSGLSSTTQSPVSLGSELFLELLEGYVLTDQLLLLPARVLQDLFPLYAFKRRLPQLEQMLLHLNPLALELDFLLPSIKAYRLFSACIYMYNRGKSAFDLPLSESLGVLTDPANLAASSSALSLSTAANLLSSPSSPLGPITESEKSALSYKLLLYVDYCFEGVAFPRKGMLPLEYRAGVRAQVLSVLFRKEVRIGGDEAGSNSITLPEFPYLAYFLNLHTEEFLHILSIVFEERDEEWMQYVENAAQTHAKSPSDGGASFPGMLGTSESLSAGPGPIVLGSPAGGLPSSTSFSGGIASTSFSNGPPSMRNAGGPQHQQPETPTGSSAHSRIASLSASFSSLLQQYSPLGDAPSSRQAPQQVSSPYDMHSDGSAPPNFLAAAPMPPAAQPAKPRVMPQQYLKATGVPSRQQLLDALLYLILDTMQQSPPATSTSHAAMMVPFTYVDRPAHVHALFRFAAKYVARGVVTASKIFSQRIFLYLCSNEGAGIASGARSPQSAGGAANAVSEEKSDRAERQRMLLSLLARVPDVDADALLSQALAAGFNGVCVVLNIRKGDFPRTLEALLKAIELKDDTVLPESLLQAMPPNAPETQVLQSVCNKPLVAAVFDFIHESLQNPALTPQKTSAIRNATLAALPHLVTAHSERTARLILEDFRSDHERVVTALASFPQLQFQYLKAFIAGARNSDKPTGGSAADVTAPSGRELSMPELLQRSGLQLTPRMHEQYIQLLCIYAPNDVLAHVSSHHGWELDNVLKLCQQYRIDDAAAFLMEKTHDLSGAMELMLRSVDARLLDLRRLVEAEWRNFPEPKSPSEVPNLSKLHMQNAAVRRGSGADDPSDRVVVSPAAPASLVTSPAYLSVDKKLIHSITTASLLCQRHEQDAKVLWFTLLDRFVELQRSMKRIHEAKDKDKVQSKSTSGSDADVRASIVAPMVHPVYLYMQSALFSYVRLILSSMMQHLDLPSLFAKITTDHQADSLREFRDTIQGLLDTYSYEQSILTTANALLSSDKFHSVEMLQRRKAAALQPISDSCGICSRPMSDTQFVAKFILFDCGHIFHDACLGRQADRCMLCQRESSKKRAGSRGVAEKSAPIVPPAVSPTASGPSAPSGGTEKAAIEFVHRLQLAERRFEKGTVRSVDSFNARLKRFARGGGGFDEEDDEAGPVRNPFEPDIDDGEDDHPAHDDEEDGGYGRHGSVDRRGSRAYSEAEEFSFQLPSLRADVVTSREPGRMAQPVAVKSIDLTREPVHSAKK